MQASGNGDHRLISKWQRARRMLGSLVVIGVVTAALDITLATALGDRLHELAGINDEYWVPSAIYDHDLPPLTDRTVLWLREPYRLATNSLGFKDSAPKTIPLAATQPRLLMLGDSFTEGVGVQHTETVAGILQERLSPQGIEVLNAGVFSYHPALYWRKAHHWISERGLEVSHVIVLIDISDIPNALEAPEADAEGNFDGFAAEPPTRRILRILKDHSFILSLADRIKDLIQYRAQVERIELTGVRRLGAGAAAWTLTPDARAAVGEPGLARARAWMERLAAFLAERRIPLAIAVYPWPDQIAAGEPPSIQADFWRAWSSERGLAFVDLFPTFASQVEASTTVSVIDRYFIASDVHWNPAGHRYVADALLACLKGWLGTSAVSTGEPPDGCFDTGIQTP